MRRMRHAPLAVVLLAACSGAPAPTAVLAPAPSSAAPSTPAPSPPAPSLYHLPGRTDAVSLELDLAAGTFRWGIFGCDFSGGSHGSARVEGDAIVLEGPELRWMAGGGFANAVDAVRFTRDGDALVTTIALAGGDPEPQRWERGGTCADCGDQLGPIGQHACDDPYLGEPR